MGKGITRKPPKTSLYGHVFKVYNISTFWCMVTPFDTCLELKDPKALNLLYFPENGP
jgi:hypothetical protein